MANFKMDDYNDVAARIRDFKAKHPEGSLQPADIHDPFRVQIIGDKVFIVYTALAYRTPNDERPGVGVAWEPFPGPTQFTKDSELQNAETSAWGRAIVAALAADTKKGIASAEDIRNRQPAPAPVPLTPEQEGRNHLHERIRALTPEQREKVRTYCDEHKIPRVVARMDLDQLAAVGVVVDQVCIAAAQDAAAEAPQTPVEPPQPAETGNHTTPDPAEPQSEAVDGLQAAIDLVAGMTSTALSSELVKRGLPTHGSAAARAQRLVAALVDGPVPAA